MTGKHLAPVVLLFVMFVQLLPPRQSAQWFLWLSLNLLWTVLVLILSLNVDEDKGIGAQKL